MEIAYKEADAALNTSYQKLMAKLDHQNGPRLHNGKTIKESLKQSQLAWLKFRDLNCSFEAFPAADNPSGYTYLTKLCLIRMAKERTDELNHSQ